MGRACSTNGDRKGMHIGYWWESQKERDRWEDQDRWVDIIKMALGERGWDGVDCINLAYDMDQWRALVNTVMNLWVPKNAGKLLSSCTIVGFSRRARLHELSDCTV
jgi:hypothetical protein